MGNNQRATLNFDDDAQTVDIEELAGKGKHRDPLPDAETVKAVAEQSGFPSRDPNAKRPRRRRGKKSPYTAQMGIRVRPEMKGLFQDMAEHLDLADNAAFETALHALVEAHGTANHKQTYERILRGKS